MNIIKKVVVFIMGIVVIGVVSTAVGITTQSKTVEKNVTFEILDNGTYTPNVFENIVLYSENANLSMIKLNNVITNDLTLTVFQHDFRLRSVSQDGEDVFTREGIFAREDDIFQDGDVITVTFAVEVETPVIIKTLLVLIPLVFTTSLIGYLSLSVRNGKNE